jgi:hypothetical protein
MKLDFFSFEGEFKRNLPPASLHAKPPVIIASACSVTAERVYPRHAGY